MTNSRRTLIAMLLDRSGSAAPGFSEADRVGATGNQR
jgi:hypothetical protein